MSDPVRSSARVGALLALGLVLTACSSMNDATHRLAGVVTPYKIDVVQGNFVSSEQVALLKPGMNRQAVRTLLGTPLLQSVFHADRWDYVFTFQHKNDDRQLRKVTVFFNGDVLDRFDADAVPTEAEFVASLDARRNKSDKVPLLEASEETLKQFPVANKAPESKPLPPLPASYPPLETTVP